MRGIAGIVCCVRFCVGGKPRGAPDAPRAAFACSIVVIGHVDSGKSTTTGHLIYKLGGIDSKFACGAREQAFMASANPKISLNVADARRAPPRRRAALQSV